MRAYKVTPEKRHTGGRKRTVVIQIHRTHKAFLKASGYAKDSEKDLYVASTHSLLYKGKRRRTRNPVAIVNLYKGGITTEAIAHEMTHVAFAIYRADTARKPAFGVGPDKREEQVAYLVGDLVAKVSRVLRGEHVKGSSIN
jgi:hypothetical protein